MRWALGLAFGLMIASPGLAADLTIARQKTLVRVHHYKALRAVRDYDGTPIVIRRRLDGTYDTHVAMRANPTRYFNGQRVMP
jgi:hypothetical protein